MPFSAFPTLPSVHSFRRRAARTTGPNILFIFSDDHAYQAISAYDSSRNKTPNIDRLAKEGMRFDRCVRDELDLRAEPGRRS